MPAKKRAPRGTRKPKSDQIAEMAPPEVEEGPKPVSPASVLRVDEIEMGEVDEIDPQESIVEVKTDSETVQLFEGAPPVPVRDDLSPDQDLTEAQKAEFKRILDRKMPILDRAEKLVKLAGMTGNKTAPVALRAIQIINEITGLTKEESDDAPSMFKLPEGVHVSIDVETPKK